MATRVPFTCPLTTRSCLRLSAHGLIAIVKLGDSWGLPASHLSFPRPTRLQTRWRAQSTKSPLKYLLCVAFSVPMLITSKSRLWTGHIACPGIPTFIFAAVPISSKVKADELIDMQVKLVNGLLEHGVHVSSLGADGASKECSILRHFACSAPAYIDFVPPHPAHPQDSARSIKIRIICWGKDLQATALIEDPGRGRKTFRANIYSGARLLTLGNYIACYSLFLAVYCGNGPHDSRDVLNVDKQSDNTVIRVFSSATMKYLIDNHPDQLGTIVYLVVLGSLPDAYQSRDLTLIERIKIALRAMYFLHSCSTGTSLCTPRATRLSIASQRRLSIPAATSSRA